MICDSTKQQSDEDMKYCVKQTDGATHSLGLEKIQDGLKVRKITADRFAKKEKDAEWVPVGELLRNLQNDCATSGHKPIRKERLW